MAGPRLTLQTLAVLTALLENPTKPVYGLDVSRRAHLPTGSIYPILARLERAGWVESYWEDIDESVEKRRRRRYYRLTGEGARIAQREVDRAVGLLAAPRPAPAGY